MNFQEVLNTATLGGSDYALSKKLGVPRQTISHYRNGRRLPSDEMLDKIAEISGLLPAQVYLAAYAEKLGNPEVAKVFRELTIH